MLEIYDFTYVNNMIDCYKYCLIWGNPESFDRFELKDIPNSRILIDLISQKHFEQSFKLDLDSQKSLTNALELICS